MRAFFVIFFLFFAIFEIFLRCIREDKDNFYEICVYVVVVTHIPASESDRCRMNIFVSFDFLEARFTANIDVYRIILLRTTNTINRWNRCADIDTTQDTHTHTE